MGDQVAIGVSFFEDNFLGTATRAGVSFSSDPIRTTFALEFRQPRLFSRSVGLGARWENRSDGTVVLGAPQPALLFDFGRPGLLASAANTATRRSTSISTASTCRWIPSNHVMGSVRAAVAWALRRNDA